MTTLICGSLAFDSIATFPGRFVDQILPEKLHILNVSFLVPNLRREFGGCAGNIAYNLAALGAQAIVVAAVGSDGADYMERLRSWGLATPCVRMVEGAFTAQAFIMTDLDNNQITAFHPGAMQSAHEIDVPDPNREIPVGTTGEVLIDVGEPSPATEIPASRTVSGSPEMSGRSGR